MRVIVFVIVPLVSLFGAMTSQELRQLGEEHYDVAKKKMCEAGVSVSAGALGVPAAGPAAAVAGALMAAYMMYEAYEEKELAQKYFDKASELERSENEGGLADDHGTYDYNKTYDGADGLR